jgi:DNA polymerase I-like protein with 3'-5' exonuclease and polymerase domains
MGKNKRITLDEFISKGEGRKRVFLEVDYSGMETRVIAMVSGDLELIRQVIAGQKWNEDHLEGGINPYDLHRRWGGKVLQKNIEEVTKDERYRGKNGFVFPSIYGSTDLNVARSFPEVKTTHVVKVQKEFWEEYQGVREWQKKTIHDYCKDGFVEAPNGWRRVGPLSINQLYNNIIQGTAFHILLASLIDIDKVLVAMK